MRYWKLRGKLAAALGLTLVLGSCTSLPWKKPAPASYACYWMTPDGARWQAMPDLSTKALCFEMDSCNGGQGGSGGGCYKWATAASAPGEKW